MRFQHIHRKQELSRVLEVMDWQGLCLGCRDYRILVVGWKLNIYTIKCAFTKEGNKIGEKIRVDLLDGDGASVN